MRGEQVHQPRRLALAWRWGVVLFVAAVPGWWSAGWSQQFPNSKVGVFRDGFLWVIDANGNGQYDDPSNGGTDRAWGLGEFRRYPDRW